MNFSSDSVYIISHDVILMHSEMNRIGKGLETGITLLTHLIIFFLKEKLCFVFYFHLLNYER